MKDMASKAQRQIFSLAISQINLLVCLVNDIVDLNRIEEGSFHVHTSEFNARNALNFVISIFAEQC